MLFCLYKGKIALYLHHGNIVFGADPRRKP